MKFYAVIFPVVLLLGACSADYRDISADPGQRPLMDQMCEVTAVLRAHGVALTAEREKKTDYISIGNPGFSGPEVTFLVPLQPGTKLHVLAARECSNCLFDRLIEYQVQVSPEPPQFAGKPAYIRAESLDKPYVSCTARNAV